MEDEQENLQNVRVKREVVWQNVLLFIYLHMSALYGIFLMFLYAKYATVVFTFMLIIFSTLSVTLGCHRLWAHQAYKANYFMKLFFIVGHTLTSQGCVYDWVLDHRIHHRYHGTDIDPYNYKKGFLYAQITGKLFTPHPENERIKRKICMSDIEEESLVMWQKTLYWIIWPIVNIFLPLNFIMEYFNESFLVAIFVAGFLRITISLHYAWLIHSATILWGLDPLDKRSTDTNLIFVVNKSLWPQYHYLVPWDYQVGEYGNYGDGFCNGALRVFAALGWIYNLRTVNSNGIRRALYESTKTGKPVMQCILQEEKNVLYDEMITNMYKYSRI
ncbi:hypothetical protein PGB90_002178 [Kerria lacca]